ncbi:hypothetical protein LXH09_37390 [Streptomyces sp. CS7]|uniref:hypothetical protein n=1 Tax=Streptomyces sp. CS-7 TaxID=2906769 RepID=UPI0021B41098|nr:hypothetical protein [Streptomyces sp. CS-7]MCT6782298.1 hypothetical protein [Streptomyces sp. CS-7]
MAAIEELQLDGQLLGGLSPARFVELVRFEEEFAQQDPHPASGRGPCPLQATEGLEPVSPVGDETDARTAFQNSGAASWLSGPVFHRALDARAAPIRVR